MLDCNEDQTYISVFKQNSPTSFNQREESFVIKGAIDKDYYTFVSERPLNLFRENKTYEYCLPKTEKLLYDVFLLDSYF